MNADKATTYRQRRTRIVGAFPFRPLAVSASICVNLRLLVVAVSLVFAVPAGAVEAPVMADAGAPFESAGGAVRLSLYPCQLRALHVK